MSSHARSFAGEANSSTPSLRRNARHQVSTALWTCLAKSPAHGSPAAASTVEHPEHEGRVYSLALTFLRPGRRQILGSAEPALTCGTTKGKRIALCRPPPAAMRWPPTIPSDRRKPDQFTTDQRKGAWSRIPSRDPDRRTARIPPLFPGAAGPAAHREAPGVVFRQIPEVFGGVHEWVKEHLAAGLARPAMWPSGGLKILFFRPRGGILLEDHGLSVVKDNRPRQEEEREIQEATPEQVTLRTTCRPPRAKEWLAPSTVHRQ